MRPASTFTLALRIGCLAVVVGAIRSASESVVGSSPRRPNVLLVSIDSLRADHVHSYGYPKPTTPAIDSLARDGALFRTVVSSSSWTLPAHMTLLTAMAPEQHGVTRAWSRLSPDAVTLAEVLRDAGYATAGFVSGPTVRALYGFDQGFDVYDDRTAMQANRRLAHLGITAPKLVPIVEHWLEQWAGQSPRRPFFVFLHLWDVHYDYAPPPPYDAMFDPDYAGGVTANDYERNGQVHAGMDRRDLEHVVALYDGEIRFTDDWLDVVLRRLRSLEVLDETVVVVTSDHGDEFFEHGRKGHAKELFDETVLVPLVVRFPPRVPGRRIVDRQVRLMDVAPTILGLVDVPRPEGFGAAAPGVDDPGRDLSAWISGTPPVYEVRDLLAFSEAQTLGRKMDAVRSRHYKLIRREEASERRLLFDLAADPGEQRNLVATAEGQEKAKELEGIIDRWVRSAAAAGRAPGRAALDPDQLDRLRSLGYEE